MLAMSALAGVLCECPIAELGRDEADQAADSYVRHLVTLDTSVDPGARDLEEARRLARVPQAVSKLFCGVHGDPEVHGSSRSSQHIRDTCMHHYVFCRAMYLSSRRLTRYSRKSCTFRFFRSRSSASIIGFGSRYQDRESSMRSLTTSFSDCLPVSFIRCSSQLRS